MIISIWDIWYFLWYFKDIWYFLSEVKGTPVAHSEPSKTSKMELLAKIVDGFHSRSQYYHRTLYDVLQQIELTKGTSPSQRTQLLGVKLKKFFTSYRHLKTQMHSVSTGFPSPVFYKHFKGKFTYAGFLYSKP